MRVTYQNLVLFPASVSTATGSRCRRAYQLLIGTTEPSGILRFYGRVDRLYAE